MKSTHRRAGIVLVCAAALAACGGGSGKSATKTSAKQASATTAPSAAGGGTSDQGKALGKIRVGNFLTVNGAPGPAMDLYDKAHPGAGDTPIIKNLAYGQVSDYVSPHTPTPYDTSSNLYVFAAGSTQPSGPLTGSGIDNSGFVDGDQLTIAIGPSADSSGTTSLEFAEIDEAGSRAQGGDDLSAPAGKGVLLVRSALGGLTNSGGEYISIDGPCPNATNNDEGGAAFPDLGETKTFTFPVDPGAHQLGVIATPPGTGLATCAGHAPTGTASATVGAGQRVEVFVYGTPTALKVTSAPVAS